MKSELEIIVNNLKDSFDGKPWYGISVMEKLNAVPWQKVNDKVYGEKTIAILVQHIMNWRIFVLKRLEGDLSFDIVVNGENDWNDVQINNEAEWNSLKQKLQNTQDRLIELLSKETDDLLNKLVPGKDYSYGPILTSIAQHDIYHLGQIAMLNSMM